MVYDCFSFFNEHMVLDVRLNTLYDKVDKFILIEATRSHQNLKKPLFFEENKHLYSAFLDKIIHVVVDDYPTHSYWSFEENQRDFIMDSLAGIAQNDDIIFVSDVDEIWDPSVIDLVSVLDNKIYKWPSYVCFHFFNLIAQKEYWYQPQYCKYSTLKHYCIDQGMKLSYDVFRNRANQIKKDNYIYLNELGGWHLSYTEDIEYKLQNFLHSEYRGMSYDYFLSSIKSGRNPFTQNEVFLIENIDDHLPDYIKANKEKFKQYILTQ